MIWPQMIDDMFWPFTIKSVAKRQNSLQIDTLGRTPESILHGIEVQEIPVKLYRTLFCRTYVLDAVLQSAGGEGPPKWEPRSQIGVYIRYFLLLRIIFEYYKARGAIKLFQLN